MTAQGLKEWREAHGWTQKQAARYLGTLQASISRWEDGKREVPEYVALLAHLLKQERNIRIIEELLYTRP